MDKTHKDYNMLNEFITCNKNLMIQFYSDLDIHGADILEFVPSGKCDVTGVTGIDKKYNPVVKLHATLSMVNVVGQTATMKNELRCTVAFASQEHPNTILSYYGILDMKDIVPIIVFRYKPTNTLISYKSIADMREIITNDHPIINSELQEKFAMSAMNFKS